MGSFIVLGINTQIPLSNDNDDHLISTDNPSRIINTADSAPEAERTDERLHNYDNSQRTISKNARATRSWLHHPKEPRINGVHAHRS